MCFLCGVEARVLGSLRDLTYAHVCTRNRVTKSNPSLNSAHPYCPYVSVTPIHVSGNAKKTLKMSVDFSSESHEREEPWRKESRDTSSVCPLIRGFLICIQLQKENKKLCVLYVCKFAIYIQLLHCFIHLWPKEVFKYWRKFKRGKYS